MKEYNLPKALEGVLPFIDDLSNWFVRRSRRRFSKNEDASDKAEAFFTLYTVLTKLAQILAPFTPFLSEELYQKMTGAGESVHLLDYPKSTEVDAEVLEKMARTREIITEALALRMRKSETEAQIKVRQPLAKLVYAGPKLDEFYEGIIAEEVNVKEVANGEELSLDKTITPELAKEGFSRDLIRAVQAARKQAGLKPDDRILLSLSVAIPEGYSEMVAAETLADEIVTGGNFAFDTISKVGEENVTISLEKK